jgi:hypothetical protein
VTDRWTLAARLRRIGEESRADQLIEATDPTEIEARMREAEVLVDGDRPSALDADAAAVRRLTRSARPA